MGNISKDKKYSCSYERDLVHIIYVTKNGNTESLFRVTPVIRKLKLIRTWAKKNELSIQKEVAEDYLRELIKNHLV